MYIVDIRKTLRKSQNFRYFYHNLNAQINRVFISHSTSTPSMILLYMYNEERD